MGGNIFKNLKYLYLKSPDRGKKEIMAKNFRKWKSVVTDRLKNCDKPQNCVITHLEPDILECEVKWALGSITKNKASGGDGIPAELSQILKDDAEEVLHSIYQQIWKTQQWPWTGKGQFSFQSQWRAMPKNIITTTQLHSFHMLESNAQIPEQARLKQHMNRELPDVQAEFRKDRRKWKRKWSCSVMSDSLRPQRL